jgi:hypothetical protein
MHVVAGDPHNWFLLEDDGALYLDVNCRGSREAEQSERVLAQ